MIVAIDGPSAAGKGTLGLRLAAHLGFDYLDTGSLYRAVGLAVLRAGADPASVEAAVAAAASLDLGLLEDPASRGDAVAMAASQVAALGPVREALLEAQRRFALVPPSGRGAVLDGRDVGTVVCPRAEVKLFVTASLEARALRRFKELQARGARAIWETVLRDMRDRDARDSGRDVAPLKPASDSIMIDTTLMTPDEVFQRALAVVAPRLGPGVLSGATQGAGQRTRPEPL